MYNITVSDNWLNERPNILKKGLYAKFYQNKESKKVSLKAALENLYEELEETKLIYNSII